MVAEPRPGRPKASTLTYIHTVVEHSRRYIDFSSWQGTMTKLIGLAIFTLLGVGIRVLMMQTVQQRRERMNRQINERLKTLISAYRTLGGSFTGQLTVDPTHLGELRAAGQSPVDDRRPDAASSSDRSRRIRDAVEAALADILLLGTEEHCRRAGQAASDLAGCRPIHTADLAISLRGFIRAALDLGPIPGDVVMPLQGPTRAQGSGGRSKGAGNRAGGKGGGGGDMAGGGMGMGMAMGADHRDADHAG